MNRLKKKEKIYLFMKIGEEQFMQKLFEEGEIYMNNTLFFRNHTNNEIGDEFEGIDYIEQSHKEDINNRNAINNCAKFIYSGQNNYLYCLWCLDDVYAKEHINDKNELIIDLSDFQTFGADSVVLINPSKLIAKIDDKLKEINKTFKHNPVTYYDDEVYDGKVTPFMKRKKYAHQNEFRYAVDGVDKPFFSFKIGSIKEFARLTPINKKMKITFNVSNVIE